VRVRILFLTNIGFFFLFFFSLSRFACVVDVSVEYERETDLNLTFRVPLLYTCSCGSLRGVFFLSKVLQQKLVCVSRGWIYRIYYWKLKEYLHEP
jgi:hypothetical protein